VRIGPGSSLDGRRAAAALARDLLVAQLEATWSPPVDLVILVAAADGAVRDALDAAGGAAEPERWATAAEAAEAVRAAVPEHPVPPGPLIAAAGDLARSARQVAERLALDDAFGRITGSDDVATA
jgi:hypothetical protein